MGEPIDECASTCARLGLPLAVLAADGTLSQSMGEFVENRNETLMPHDVEGTGEVPFDDGGARLIAATDLEIVGR